MNKTVKTNNAPQAIGPYSQGIDTGEFIFFSGLHKKLLLKFGWTLLLIIFVIIL